MLDLSVETENGAAILELFGAERFIPAKDEDYVMIEKVGRQLGKIR